MQKLDEKAHYIKALSKVNWNVRNTRWVKVYRKLDQSKNLQTQAYSKMDDERN